MSATDPQDKLALSKMLTDQGAKETYDMIMQEIKRQKEANKELIKENPSYNPTRRDIRANRELQKLKDKINLAGNTNFD